MSLLMDALKKAEQEKKEAAKRLQEAQELPQEQQDYSLDDSMFTQEQSTEDDSTDSAQRTSEPTPDDSVELGGLSLSPVTDQQLVCEEIEDNDSLLSGSSSADQTPFIDENDKLSITGETELEISEGTESGHSPKLDKPFTSTNLEVEEVDAEQADDRADDQAQDALQAEQTYDSETLSDTGNEYFSAAVSAAQLAKDIGGGSPTPVTAQTVFTATSRPGNQVLQWSVFVVLCLVIAVSLSFFVVHYTIPVERSIKPPSVAMNIETQPEPIPTIEMPGEIVSNVDVNSSLITGEITDLIEKENELIVEEGQTESEAKGIPESERSQEMIAKAVDIQSALAREGMERENVWYPSEDNSTSDDAVAVVVETIAATLPEKIILEPGLIKISRSKSIDKRGVQINEAFQEYLVGDYDSAEVSYRNVLKELPENRDALLGLAVISSRKGQFRQAYNIYLKVLKLYPGDSTAEAALINFQRNGDYARNESILKTFILREPDNSFLYYSLGRHYAAQIRWPEAQQSFFNAYRIETSNPDYAFNLAVSLDHIGQLQSAIDYYNTALELANQSSGGSATISFDRAVVISRINALSSLVDLQ